MHRFDELEQFPDLKAISVASFGPIEIRHNSPKYGYITDTPKPGWSNVDFVGALKQAFDLPIFRPIAVNQFSYTTFEGPSQVEQFGMIIEERVILVMAKIFFQLIAVIGCFQLHTSSLSMSLSMGLEARPFPLV